MAEKHKGLIGRVRGRGTFIAFTMKDTAARDVIINSMRQRGVEIGGCGAFSIRLRPAMIFLPEHANVFLRILDEVCMSLLV